MKGITIMMFMLCLNISAWALNTMSIIPFQVQNQWNPNDLRTWFSLNIFDTATMFGLILGGIGGLVAWLLHANVFAYGIILLWIFGILFTPVNNFILGMPIFLSAILTPFGLAWLCIIPEIFFGFGFFIFLAEIMAQRQIG
jgi:hypothetical protein